MRFPFRHASFKSLNNNAIQIFIKQKGPRKEKGDEKLYSDPASSQHCAKFHSRECVYQTRQGTLRFERPKSLHKGGILAFFLFRITLASDTPECRKAWRNRGVTDARVMRTKARESQALPPPCPCQDVVFLLSAQAVNRLSPEMLPSKKPDREREDHRRGGRCHPGGDWEARI